MLDRQLAANGLKVKLRKTPASGGSPALNSVDCMAFVRGSVPQQLVGQIMQGDTNVIISPTEINAAGWPGASVPTLPTDQDPRVPVQGDSVVINGKPRKIVAPPQGIYLAGTLVRINIQVAG